MKRFTPNRVMATAMLALGMIASPLALAAKDVTFALPVAFDSLDPYNTNSTSNQAAGKAYYEGLFEFDKDLKIQKKLATDYTVSADGLVYMFKLRQGVKFQDGTDFNAEAVKVNLDRVTNPENRLTRFTQFKSVEKTEVVDPYTVRITLKEPFSPFLNALAHPSAMMISPTALKKWGNKDIAFHPVGTGPFEFVEWKPAEYLKVKKFDGYWNKGYPKVDTLTFRIVPDNNTRAAIVQTGEAQFAFPVPYEQAKSLADANKINIVDAKSIMTRYMSMNVTQKPYDNVKVREAINYAINKEALAKVAFAGYASVADGVVPQGVSDAYKIGAWPYDPKKARELLKEAGYANGFESTLWSAYNDGTSVKVVQFLQQQLAQVGIKVSVEVLESGQRVARVSQVQKPEDAKVRLLYAGWSSSTGEADWGLRPLFASVAFPPALNNTAYYKNDKVDTGINDALKITDPAAKTAAYKDIQQQIWKDAPWAFLVTQNNVSAQAKNLSGVYVLPDTSLWFNDVDLK